MTNCSICGADCSACPWKESCQGCAQTGGRPFGVPCLVARHCQNGTLTERKQNILAALNSLAIPDMEPVSDLVALKGSFVNLPYPLPGGEAVRFWADDQIYLGNQLHKRGSDRCYGIVADEQHLLVAEYGDQGAEPELVAFLRWKQI